MALGVLPAPAQVCVAMHSVQPGVALVEEWLSLLVGTGREQARNISANELVYK